MKGDDAGVIYTVTAMSCTLNYNQKCKMLIFYILIRCSATVPVITLSCHCSALELPLELSKDNIMMKAGTRGICLLVGTLTGPK